MQRVEPVSSLDRPRYQMSVADLLTTTVRHIILATNGIYLAWYAAATALWPLRFYWLLLGITLMIVLVSLLCLRLLATRHLLALVIWLMGLLLAISLAGYAYQNPEIVFLYALLPFVAVIGGGELAGLAVQALIVGLLVWFSQHGLVDGLTGWYVVASSLVGTLIGLIGWVVRRSVLISIEWYTLNLNQAERNLEAVRQQRTQLARMQKSLDLAYSRLERANAALLAAWKAAAEAERSKAELVTSVSHELRTPLNLIVGFTEMMVTSPESYDGVQLPGPYRSDLETVHHSARHLLALVDDVLDMARLDAGRVALERDAVDLKELIDEVTEMVHDYLTAKGLELRIAVAPDLPAMYIDKLRIRQVLLNLLVNAVRHTDSGCVTIEVSKRDTEVEVRVSDTGRGIRAQDLPHLFDGFQRREPLTPDRHAGTGLGLPISKRFVELHGGRMGVESSYLQGASFWFTLPCTPETACSRATPEVEWIQPASQLAALQQTLVVISEDKQVQHMLERHLEGYRVLGAAHLRQGLELARETQAVALVAEHLDPAGLDTGQLLLIACPLPNSRQAAKALGAADVLVKPVLRSALWAAIDRLGRPVKQVLIADEDAEVVRLLRRLLHARKPPIRCLEAYTNDETLQLMRRERPDLVLLDPDMGRNVGPSLLQRIVTDSELSSTPVIAVSGQSYDYLGLPLHGAIQFSRANGFQTGEVVQTLAALLKTLVHPRHPLGSMAEARAATSLESPVWSDRPSHPVSAPAAAR